MILFYLTVCLSMIDANTVSLVRDIVAIFGVVAGFTYYVITVRNAQKARSIQLVTQITNLTSEENQKTGFLLHTLQFDGYDDFQEKYGPITNPDIFGKCYSMWTGLNTMGYYLKEGIIDITQLVGALGGQPGPVTMWYKYEDIIRESRKSIPAPELFDSWEYLVGKLEKYYKKKGMPLVNPFESDS